MHRIVLCLGLFLASSLLASTAGAINVYLDYNSHSEAQTPEGAITLGVFLGTPADRAEILESLREDFAPFGAIGIYDVPAPARPSRGWIRLVIGGDTGQLGNRQGLATWDCDPATAPWCDVSPDGNNVVWVAERSSGGPRLTNRSIANTAAHELGHAFGNMALDKPWATLETYLSHYVVGGPFGRPSHNLISQGKTQIMGGPGGGGIRDIWWKDPDVAKAWTGNPPTDDPANWVWSWQDDILTLASVLGLRRADHGDTPARGTGMKKWTGTLQPEETRVVGTGVVEMNGRSWPGMCPPVPLWMPCAFTDAEGKEVPPREVPGGQGVALALARDFFRFDVPRVGNSNYQERLEIVVETLNRRNTGRTVANLDADLEVWFNDPVNGWTDITSLGSKDLGKLWARWKIDFSTSPGGWYGRGQYAVGVKSAGAYGDLGNYTVHVYGKRTVEVAPVFTGGPHTIGLRWRGHEGPEIFELAKRIQKLPELREAVAALATHGASEENLALLIDDPGALEPSDEARIHIDKALTQAGAARVLAGLIDWEELGAEEADVVWAEIRDTVAHIEPEREIASEPEPFESGWFHGEGEVCATELAIW